VPCIVIRRVVPYLDVAMTLLFVTQPTPIPTHAPILATRTHCLMESRMERRSSQEHATSKRVKWKCTEWLVRHAQRNKLQFTFLFNYLFLFQFRIIFIFVDSSTFTTACSPHFVFPFSFCPPCVCLLLFDDQINCGSN
jgi:hypothetical protein